MEELGKSETRKLQQTGGSSFIVSLPKPWVVQNGLGPKDQVKIEWRPNGSLRIIAEEASVRRRSEIEIDLDNTNDSFLLEYLIGAYLSGAQLIRLRTKTHVDKDVRKILRRFIQTTRGVEIISESEKTIELITMLNPQDMPLLSSINRMYLLISSSMRDVSDALIRNEILDIEDATEKEKEVDALRLLLERQTGQILVSASMSNTFGTDRWEAAELTNIVRSMERMGDHAYSIACLASELPIPSDLDPEAMPLGALPVWQSSFKLLMSNLRKLRILEVQKTKGLITTMIKKLDAYEEQIVRGVSDDVHAALFYDKLSEYTRRMLAYTSDMAESLINIHAYRNKKEVILPNIMR